MLRFTVPVGVPIRLNADTITVVTRQSFREFRIVHRGKEYAISKFCDATLEIDGHVVRVTTSMRSAAGNAGNRSMADCVSIGIDAPSAVKIERPR